MTRVLIRKLFVLSSSRHSTEKLLLSLRCFFLSSRIKQILHCCLLFTTVITTEIFALSVNAQNLPSAFDIDIFQVHGILGIIGLIALHILRFIPFLTLPTSVCNFLGLILYNSFPDKIQLKNSPVIAPFICIRTVTRGDFPKLVRSNVIRNINTCFNAGLKNFIVEVVTDNAINLPKHPKYREIVVPTHYKTESGALFKARALQYCLEDGVNSSNNNDWIVHLDEETLLTINSVNGILNFISDGKYHFGQGMITYANEKVVNWMTTMADNYRVTDDMGRYRFQFNTFHKPIFSWKGSFIVARAWAERRVSFDNGLNGSIAEDCYFCMKAFREGFNFGFVEGEMWEKSPFTFWDFLQQRRRWIRGMYLVVRSKEIPLRFKFILGVSFYGCVLGPLSTLNIVLMRLFPISSLYVVDLVGGFVTGVTIYTYIFGAIKSFSRRNHGFFNFFLYIVFATCVIPVNIVAENFAAVLGFCLNKKIQFYVVNKQIEKKVSFCGV